MVKLENFSKYYGKTPAVRDFSMECKKGEVTGLLGLNGAGKTTVLKAVCARHFAASGRVIVEETDASENPQKVRNITGFVQEIPELFSEYTVSETLAFSAEIHGLSKMELKNSFEKTVAQCSLESVLGKTIKKLSKGYVERVSFGAALIYNPSVIVLDEPTGGLDPEQIFNMRALITSLKKEKTILLSTHLMQEADALCDKIYIIKNGKHCAHGTIKEICTLAGKNTLEESFFALSEGEK